MNKNWKLLVCLLILFPAFNSQTVTLLSPNVPVIIKPKETSARFHFNILIEGLVVTNPTFTIFLKKKLNVEKLYSCFFLTNTTYRCDQNKSTSFSARISDGYVSTILPNQILSIYFYINDLSVEENEIQIWLKYKHTKLSATTLRISDYYLVESSTQTRFHVGFTARIFASIRILTCKRPLKFIWRNKYENETFYQCIIDAANYIKCQSNSTFSPFGGIIKNFESNLPFDNLITIDLKTTAIYTNKTLNVQLLLERSSNSSVLIHEWKVKVEDGWPPHLIILIVTGTFGGFLFICCFNTFIGCIRNRERRGFLYEVKRFFCCVSTKRNLSLAHQTINSKRSFNSQTQNNSVDLESLDLEEPALYDRRLSFALIDTISESSNCSSLRRKALLHPTLNEQRLSKANIQLGISSEADKKRLSFSQSISSNTNSSKKLRFVDDNDLAESATSSLTIEGSITSPNIEENTKD